MVRLDRIYTGGGDAGETSLGDGTRVRKDDALVAAYGTVDEANATIGLARLHVDAADDAPLARIQNDLFDVGADLCVPTSSPRERLRIVEGQVAWLEGEIDRVNDALAPLTSFILPGGSAASAHLHLARTVVRRAEREVIAAMGERTLNPLVLRYLNRLSDYLFVLARHTNGGGARDVLWVPGASRP